MFYSCDLLAARRGSRERLMFLRSAFLWPPWVADADIIFLPCGFFLSFFIPRLISAVGDWMSTTLPHMEWPPCEFRMHI